MMTITITINPVLVETTIITTVSSLFDDSLLATEKIVDLNHVVVAEYAVLVEEVAGDVDTLLFVVVDCVGVEVVTDVVVGTSVVVGVAVVAVFDVD